MESSQSLESLAESSDEELVLSAQQGDFEAFDEIVQRYQGRLWSLLFKFCPHQSELEDLVQTAFIKAHQNLHKWRPSGRFKSWLLRLAVNTGYDYYRKQKNEPISMAQRSEVETEQDPLAGLADPSGRESVHPNAELIERLLMNLKPGHRLVITLHYYEGFTLLEIATQLGWSLSKTKVKIHRARKELEVVLRKHGLSGRVGD